jgi:hypothetical protein
MHSNFGDASENSSFGLQVSEGQSLWPYTEVGNGASGIPRSQTTFGTLGMQVSHNYFEARIVITIHRTQIC